MVMPVCLFFLCFSVFKFAAFRGAFSERERGRGSRWIDVGVLPVLVCFACLFEQLDRVKRPLTSIRCKAPGNEQKIEQ